MIKPKKISKLQPSESYDAVIVGGGLSGLLTCALLLRQGRKVLLLEKLDKLGGRYSPELRNGFFLGSGFRFADSGVWRQAADRLGIASPTVQVRNGGALLHSTRGWIEPEEIPAWEEYYSTPCTEYPEQGYCGIITRLLDYCESQPGFQVAVSSPITAVEIAAARVKSVIVGADLELGAQDLYWCCDYKTLLEALRGEAVPEAGPERVSWLKRFVKTNPSPAVVLEFAHKQKFAEFTESLLLPFSSGEKEERRYLVGALLGNRDPSLAPESAEFSSWIAPLTDAEWGDNHETMKKIRAARRALEKAFPNFEKTIAFDRVLVLDSSVTPLARKKGDWQPLYPNLRIFADWAAPHGATPESISLLILEQLS